MRLPIDTTTIKFAAAGAAEPVLDFATKSQKTDEHGVPLFQVPVFAAGGGIKDSITIKVAGDVKGLSEFTLLKISGLVGQTCDHPPAGRTPRIGGMNRTGFDGGRSQPVNATISANFSDGCIVDCLELDWRNVAEVAVQSLVVVPVHPSEGLQFEVVNGLPWPSSRPSREFGLVEGVDGFSEGVIERISDRSNRGTGADFVESLAITNAGELLRFNQSLWHRRSSSFAPRCHLAISSVSSTISVRMLLATRQPTMLRLNTSVMKHT